MFKYVIQKTKFSNLNQSFSTLRVWVWKFCSFLTPSQNTSSTLLFFPEYVYVMFANKAKLSRFFCAPRSLMVSVVVFCWYVSRS